MKQWAQLGLTLSLFGMVVVSVGLLQRIETLDVSRADEGKSQVVTDEKMKIPPVVTMRPLEVEMARAVFDAAVASPTPTPIPTPTLTPTPRPTATPAPLPVSDVVIPEAMNMSGMAGEMIMAHNTARASVGVGGLQWSESLASDAKRWAEVLRGEGCQGRHDTGNPDGENIYWKWQTGRSGQTGLISNASEVVQSWVNERSQYDYGNNICNGVCGHYTQVVWRSTTEVGCGVSSCGEGDKQTDVWVCRYRPAGNWVGQKPY